MHPSQSTRAAQRRRSIEVQDLAPSSFCVLEIIIAAGDAPGLRRIVRDACGSTLAFLRVAVRDSGERLQVQVCVSAAMAPVLLDALVASLSRATFGAFRFGSLRELS